MKMKKTVLMIAMLFCLTACGNPYHAEETQPTAFAQEKMPESEPVSDITEPVEAAGVQKSVVIRAVVKEITQGELLISSKSDSFPGAFRVKVPAELSDGNDLTGGEQIRIAMKELPETDADGLPCYEALLIMEDQGLAGREDILLTDAPQIRLQDTLSGTLAEYILTSGSYTWNYREGEEWRSVTACGAELMGAAKAVEKKLDIPDYNGMDGGIYSMGTAVLPDQMVIQEWKRSEEGEAEQLSETASYAPSYMLSLKKDRVYLIIAEWKEGSSSGFFGEAEYVLVTE